MPKYKCMVPWCRCVFERVKRPGRGTVHLMVACKGISHSEYFDYILTIMQCNWTFIQFWEICMLLLRHKVSYDSHSLKFVKTTCPLPLSILWLSHSVRMRTGWRRRERQLLFTEISGIATVTPGHSQSIRYQTQSFKSQEGTEVDHPVKPIGIPLHSDLSRPPCFPCSK